MGRRQRRILWRRFLCVTAFTLSTTDAFSVRRRTLLVLSPSQPTLYFRPKQLQLSASPEPEPPVSASPVDSETRPINMRRRHLIVSMISTASLSPLLKRSLADDTEATTNNPPGAVAPSFVDVIQPPMDDRDYLTLRLDNGLRVLLCSDLSTNEAAAAMDVHVGALSDPVNVPGLAHFNEHMLFLGTKQYPEENSFEAFLSNNGGSSNAYTDAEDTVYYFDMEVETGSKLFEGLRRFGSFFSDPLFTQSATGRELNAIESENKVCAGI